MRIVSESSQSIGPESSDTETSEPLTGPPLNQSMLFAEAFLVSRTHSPALARVPPTSATCGTSSIRQFASLAPDGSWRKTFQDCYQVNLDGSLDEYLETWPRAGSMSNGIACQHPPSALLTDEIASGLWPTATASGFDVADIDALCARRARMKAKHGNGNGFGLTLNQAVKMWPTPTARDFRSQHAEDSASFRARQSNPRGVNLVEELQRRGDRGQLNPTWVEWLMGYPLGWTALEGSATPLSRKSRNGSHR